MNNHNKTATLGALCALILITGILAPVTTAEAARHVFLDDPELVFEDEGRVTVRWRSVEPLPPGRLVYGVDMADDPYRDPRFRFSSREKGDEPRDLHEASVRLDRVQHPRVDANLQIDAGGGVVRGRLELFVPASRKLEYRYFRFAYLRDGDSWWRLPCLTSGPWLDRVGPETAWISWSLDLPAEVRLRYGPADVDPELWREEILWCDGHSEQELTGLEPERRYAYTVVVMDDAGRHVTPRRWEFTTAPPVGAWPADGHLRLAFLSDSRGAAAGALQAVEGTNRKMIRRLFVQAERAGADLICFGGDLIDGYTDKPAHYAAQLAAWKKAAECVGPRLPIYEGMGNHEMLADDFSDPERGLTSAYRDRAGAESSETLFAEAFVSPENGPAQPPGEGVQPYGENVYSFDIGPVHVVAMNNTYDVSSHPDRFGGYREGWLPDEELAWLNDDLAAARAAGQQEVFLYAHEPAFPCGGHSGDGMYWGGRLPDVLEMRARFWRILMDHRVRVVGFGDEHNYSRLRVDSRMGPNYTVPVWQIVSGGVGAPFYAQELDLPWADKLSAFSTVQHFCIIDYSAEGVRLEVYDSYGRLLDEDLLD